MGERLQFQFDRFLTPIGEMLIVADAEGNLRAVDWAEAEYEARMHMLMRRYYGKQEVNLQPVRNPHGISEMIGRYFEGELAAIDAIPVRTGGTEFQCEVWRALRTIPCGTTISYAKLAEQIGRPSAVRAVGLANGANPIGVVVPCHRVIGANGSLTGYGGGIERKAWLLKHEAGASDGWAFPLHHR